MSLEYEFSLSLATVTKWNRSKFILTIHQPTFVRTKPKIVPIKEFIIFVRVLFY